MNLLKGSEDLSWYVEHWGDERGLIFVSVPLSLPCFFLRIFASLMAHNHDFTHPDAQGQRITKKYRVLSNTRRSGEDCLIIQNILSTTVFHGRQ